MNFSRNKVGLSARIGILSAIVFAVLFLIAALAAVFAPSGIAFADSLLDFDVIFPTSGYFQSVSPSLISANGEYLIVYDEQDCIYVRDNSTSQTRVYNVSLGKVSGVYALGNSAFIASENGYYTIDLSVQAATPVPRVLSTPANISYINCDGEYLYAKSAAGYLTVYDSSLSVAFGTDNVYNENFFTGNTVFAGNGGTAYIFGYDYGEPVLYSYNPQTSGYVQYPLDFSDIQQASAGNVIFARTASTLVALDTNGKTLFVTDIIPDAFCAYNDRLFIVNDRSISVYTLAQNQDGIILDSTISMAGSDSRHLDAPADVTISNGSIVVADRNNSRLAFVSSGSATMNALTLENAPFAVTSGTLGMYAACENDTIYAVRNGAITTEYTLPNLIDITYLDKLYALTSDGIYTLFGGNFIKISDTVGKRISCAEQGTSLYVLQNSGIAVLNSNGMTLYTLPCDLSSTRDIAIDYAGDIFAISDTTVTKYDNNLTSMALSQTYVLSNSAYNAHMTSAILSGASLYFTTEECFVASANVDAQTKGSFVPTVAPTFTENEAYEFYAPLESGTIYLVDPNRPDSCMTTELGTMIVFSNLIASNGLNYALYNGDLIVVDSTLLTPITPTALDSSVTYSANTGATLYLYPNIEIGKITLDADTTLTSPTNAAEYDNGEWYTVVYTNKTFFVRASEILSQEVVVCPPESEYGKAKAERVGGTVNIYLNADTSSQVLAQVVDGTKVQIINTLDGYYQVSYGDVIGYMSADTVQLSGLTSVQIIAIVLSLVVALIGVVIFVSISTMRKKNEK